MHIFLLWTLISKSMNKGQHFFNVFGQLNLSVSASLNENICIKIPLGDE